MKKSKVLSNINPLFLKGVCHRGLHSKTITENSLEAFKEAIKINHPYELDVHLTKDKELVVIHDSTLERVTKEKGEVEDLTLKEIKENYRLLNGEVIPSLKEVLALDNCKTPLVIELKPSTRLKNYKELALKTYDLIKDYDKRNILIISFYPQCLFPLKRKGFMRLFLINLEHKHLFFFRHFFEGVDMEYTFFDLKKYQKVKKKKLTLSWTIEQQETLKKYTKYVDSVTYQFLDNKEVEEELGYKGE